MAESKRKPDLSGIVQTTEKEVGKRKEVGRIGLWLNDSENPRAPKYVGEMKKNNKGTKFKISVWQNSESSKEEGEEDHLFQSKGKCWTCGKVLTKKDLVMNYCNDCAVKVPSKWEI